MADGSRRRDVPGVTTETKPWPPQPESPIVTGSQSEMQQIMGVLSGLQQQVGNMQREMSRRDHY